MSQGDGARAAIAGGDVPVHLHAEPADAAIAMCAVAERIGADLIVVGNTSHA
jgi:nucleotide-binding universal stress UspA family protein